MLGEVQLVVIIATEAVNALCLDDFDRDAVGVADVGRAGARLDELGRDPQLLQVPLLLNRV